MKLTKAECDRLKPKEKSYKKFDGGGLYLEVMPKGAKLWRLKYYYHGKEKRLSFGPYPKVTLKDAREKREHAKKLLDEGINPSIDRKLRKRDQKTKSSNSFESIAREWHTRQEDRWSKKRKKVVMQRLEKYIFPEIGFLPISEIEPAILLETLKKIEEKGVYYTAKSVRQICGQIFRYGIQTSRCKYDPAQVLSGVLKSRPVEHLATIDASEIPEFLHALNSNDARLFERTRNAIMFSMLTFCRPGEIRQARWVDIDFNEAQWIIPAKFMKMRKPHIVPLSKQALEILEKQRIETELLNSKWVFPARNNPKNPMSDATVNLAIKKLGFKGRMTAHGFRALARTTIREKLGYYPDVIEVQLAHKPMGPLGAAYDRAQFLDDRAKMMQDWADYIYAKGYWDLKL